MNIYNLRNRRIWIGLFIGLPSTFSSAKSYDVYDILANPFQPADFYTNELKDTPSRWYQMLENDAAFRDNTDKYYTNSIRLIRYRDLKSPFYVDGLKLIKIKTSEQWKDIEKKNNVYQVRYSQTFGHHLYTPNDYAHRYVNDVREKNFDKIYGSLYDRPFASWVYLAQQLSLNSKEINHSHLMSYGFVGSIAHGQDVQEYAHSVPFSGPDPIPGWETEVGDRLALQYGYHISRPFSWEPSDRFTLSMSPYAGFDYGTIFERAQMGVRLSLNYNRNNKSCVTVRSPSDSVDPQPEIVSFNQPSNHRSDTPPAGAEEDANPPAQDSRRVSADAIFDYCKKSFGDFSISYSYQKMRVFKNYLIEGGIHFPEIGEGTEVEPIELSGTSFYPEIEEYVDTHSIIGTYHFHNTFAITYGYTERSPELKNQDTPHHRYGWLAFDFKFDSMLGFWALPALVHYVVPMTN